MKHLSIPSKEIKLNCRWNHNVIVSSSLRWRKSRYNWREMQIWSFSLSKMFKDCKYSAPYSLSRGLQKHLHSLNAAICLWHLKRNYKAKLRQL